MTSITSEEMRAAYRAKCQYRRRNNVIEELDHEDKWVLHFTSAFVNVVKRKSRELQGRGKLLYCV
jgi:hypothetical protein